MPKGAVASELAKEGKKKTTLRDMPLVSTMETILSEEGFGCHCNVSALSFVRGDGCYKCFRGRVQWMRRVVLSYETLPIAAELAIAGRGCTVRTNTSTVISSLWKWRTVGAEGFEEEFELSVAVDGSMRRQEAPPQFRGRRQFVFATFHGIETFIFDL